MKPFFTVRLEDVVFIFIPFPGPLLVDTNTDCILSRAADAAARGLRRVLFTDILGEDDDIILLLSSQNC